MRLQVLILGFAGERYPGAPGLAAGFSALLA